MNASCCQQPWLSRISWHFLVNLLRQFSFYSTSTENSFEFHKILCHISSKKFLHNLAQLLAFRSEKVKSLSRVRLSETLWTVAHQAPLSVEFSRQEYCSGSPFPPPGESSPPRDWAQVFCTVGRCFTIWATKEVTSLEVKLEVKLWLFM